MTQPFGEQPELTELQRQALTTAIALDFSSAIESLLYLVHLVKTYRIFDQQVAEQIGKDTKEYVDALTRAFFAEGDLRRLREKE